MLSPQPTNQPTSVVGIICSVLWGKESEYSWQVHYLLLITANSWEYLILYQRKCRPIFCHNHVCIRLTIRTCRKEGNVVQRLLRKKFGLDSLDPESYIGIWTSQSAKRGRVRRDLIGAGTSGQGQNLGQLLKSWGRPTEFGADLAQSGQHAWVKLTGLGCTP